MQFQADVLNARLNRPKVVESTALGAAFLAGLAVGFFGSREELSALLSSDGMTFTPRMSADDRTRLLDGWNRAVKACRAF